MPVTDAPTEQGGSTATKASNCPSQRMALAAAGKCDAAEHADTTAGVD